MKYISNLIKKYRIRSIILVILVTICNILALLYNYSFKFVIDSVEERNIHEVWINFSYVLILQILVTVFTLIIYDYYLRIFQKDVERHVRNDIMSEILAWNYSKSKDITQGRLSTLMTDDIAQIGQYVSLYDFMIVANTIRFIITYLLLFSLDRVIGIIVLVSVPLYYLLTKFTMNPMKKFVREGYQAKDLLNKSALDILHNLINIKSNNIENISDKYVRIKTAELYEKEKNLQKWMAIFYFIRNFLSSFIPVIILGISVVRILDGRMTVGTLVAIFGFLGAIYLPISEIFQFYAMKNNLEPVVERIDPIINSDIDNTDKIVKCTGIPKIIIKNLSYSFGENVVIDKLNVQIEEPGLYRIVGNNGVGKSTLLNILSGLYNDFTGSVTVNVKCQSPALAYMNQKDILFDTSIENNVTLFKKHGINEYSKRIIERLDDKANKITALSGGERRILLFLRTINSNASIFLFDEPFEGIDNTTKEEMKQIIVSLSSDNIVLIVSHKDSDFEDMEHGCIYLEARE